MGEQKKASWIWQVALVLLLLGFAFWSAKRTSQRIETILYDTIMRVDTVWYAMPVEVPVPYRVIERDTIYIYDTIKFKIPIPTDTASILADFVRYYIYYDTIHYPDLNLTIEEVLSRNRIEHRAIQYQNLRETQVITTTNEPRGLFIGSDISLNGITPELSWIRDGWEYSLGYQIDFNSNHSISVGIKKQLWRPSTQRSTGKSN